MEDGGAGVEGSGGRGMGGVQASSGQPGGAFRRTVWIRFTSSLDDYA